MAQALRERITNGVITERLPSEAAIAEEFTIARTTVRRALAALESEGLIESAPGIGRRVVAGTPPGAPYERIRNDIAEQIRDGRLSIGDRLPSENQLAEQHGVSRGTVQRALATLEAAGHVESRQGVGRVVRAAPDER
ncbi:GntR family transcriptional regulator [Streptomyces sp. NPDC059740]|uniref:GntR family transcriptional regulator n=1 Tax=Streptomyces sp. NPDC059740 TaxID=3346926 RepID=UPI003665CB76